MVIGPLLSLAALSRAVTELEPMVESFPAFRELLNMTIFFTVVTVIWSVFVGYRLAKAHPNSPTVAKRFFILTPVFFIVQSFMMLSITGLPQASVDAMGSSLVIEFLKTFMSSLIWYLYIVKSKRVLYTYPNPSTHVRCPDCRKFVFAKSAICPHCKTKLIPQ